MKEAVKPLFLCLTQGTGCGKDCCTNDRLVNNFRINRELPERQLVAVKPGIKKTQCCRNWNQISITNARQDKRVTRLLMPCHIPPEFPD